MTDFQAFDANETDTGASVDGENWGGGNVYETIRTFRLVGDDAEFAIPDDDALRDEGVGMAFDGIARAFTESALADDMEPMLWGIVNLYHRRAEIARRQMGELQVAIKELIREQDGSEVKDVELQDRQREYERTDERATAFGFMLDSAAERYEEATGRAWFPRSGSHTGNSITASVIASRDYIHAAKMRETEALAPEGSRVAIAGGAEYQDHAEIWGALDRARDSVGDMVLMHGGALKGTDHVAALWAKARNVPQVAFKPDFTTYRNAAPFKRNDEMLATKPRGVIVFPGNGITMNLAQKAEGQGVKVWYRGGATKEAGAA